MATVRQRPDHRSDALLLVDADDDPAAFAVLYERHVGSVYGGCGGEWGGWPLI